MTLNERRFGKHAVEKLAHNLCSFVGEIYRIRSNKVERGDKAVKSKGALTGRPRSLFRETRREKLVSSESNYGIDGDGETYIYFSCFHPLRIASIRVGGKSTPIKVMGNGEMQATKLAEFYILQVQTKRIRGREIDKVRKNRERER